MIQTGDRVRIVKGSTAPYVGSEGTVVRTSEDSDAPYTHYVELQGDTMDVTVVWLTLPGADRSYALSEEQARALLRQLEEVV